MPLPLVYKQSKYSFASLNGYKVRSVPTGFQGHNRPVTLKNKPKSPFLEADIETHLVHNRGEYQQA